MTKTNQKAQWVFTVWDQDAREGRPLTRTHDLVAQAAHQNVLLDPEEVPTLRSVFVAHANGDDRHLPGGYRDSTITRALREAKAILDLQPDGAWELGEDLLLLDSCENPLGAIAENVLGESKTPTGRNRAAVFVALCFLSLEDGYDITYSTIRRAYEQVCDAQIDHKLVRIIAARLHGKGFRIDR